MNVIEIKNLRKKYKDNVAVDGIDLCVKKGDVFGLLGPNGAGKSTTINMICGLLKPTEGEISICGDKLENVKHKIGYVPQTLALYNDYTAVENLRFFGSLYNVKGKLLRERIDEALRFTGLEEAKNKKAKTYSGGILRRLNIACALVHKPEIIIMDEPTVGIDPQSRNHIMSSIKKLNEQGVTIIYTSHYMEEVEALCNKIAIIDKGNIIIEGTKAELKNTVKDQDTLEVVLDDACKFDTELIYKINGVNNIIVNDNVIEITSDRACNNLNAIMEILLKADVKLHNIAYKEVNLETVFLSLTGKKLRD